MSLVRRLMQKFDEDEDMWFEPDDGGSYWGKMIVAALESSGLNERDNDDYDSDEEDDDDEHSPWPTSAMCDDPEKWKSAVEALVDRILWDRDFEMQADLDAAFGPLRVDLLARLTNPQGYYDPSRVVAIPNARHMLMAYVDFWTPSKNKEGEHPPQAAGASSSDLSVGLQMDLLAVWAMLWPSLDDKIKKAGRLYEEELNRARFSHRPEEPLAPLGQDALVEKVTGAMAFPHLTEVTVKMSYDMLDLTPLLQLPHLTTLSAVLTCPGACTRTWKMLAPVAHLLRRLDLGGSNSCVEVDKDDLKSPLTALTALNSISFAGCESLPGVETPGGSLLASPVLTHLDMSSCRIVETVAALPASCPQLRTLTLFNCVRLTGLTASPSLRELDLRHCTALSELTPLSACVDLQRLDMSYCKHVTSLGPLSACTKLRVLKAEQCDALTDLTPLEHCTSLRELYLSYCVNLSTLKGLEHCTDLEVLELEGCHKADTTAQAEAGLPYEEIVAAIKAKTLVHIKYPCVSDLAPLAACTALRRLNLAWCYKVTDLAPLAACTALTSQDVSRCTLR
eukprot:gene19329-25979_t